MVVGIWHVVSSNGVSACLANRILQSHFDIEKAGEIGHGKQQKHEHGQYESKLHQRGTARRMPDAATRPMEFVARVPARLGRGPGPGPAPARYLHSRGG